MATYSRANEFRFFFKSNGMDLLVVQFTVKEYISKPFCADLELASEKELSVDQMVGQAGLLTLQGLHGSDPERYVHGMLERFTFSSLNGRFWIYKAHLVPQFKLLCLEQDCRIFQNLSVPDIIQQVLQESRILSNLFKFRLTAKYAPRDYCVQYRETDLAFISRLLEEEGLFYFFEHAKEQHLLVFGDAMVNYQPIAGNAQVIYKPGGAMVSEEEAISAFELTRQIRTGKYSLQDFNYEKPFLDLSVELKDQDRNDLEVYDYPGEYTLPDEGKRLAQVRLQQALVFKEQAKGKSVVPRMVPGFTFTLESNEISGLNKEYLLTKVVHNGAQPQVLAEKSAQAGGTCYDNKFWAIPSTVTFRPARQTRRPVINGSQTAVVTGFAGEEIYTDALGRVKVQFHWDRRGQRDDKSSCWVRVSQLWAGTGWGAMFIPRIGQEVIVDFIEGDPDRPIITGRVYNGNNDPPYKLPQAKTKSTIKSNSSKGGGGSNEIRFEDQKGSEELFFQAEKDMNIHVKNDQKTSVGQDCHLTVQRDLLKKVERDLHLKVMGHAHKEVDQDEHNKISGKSCTEVGGSLSLQVGGDVIESYQSNHGQTIAHGRKLKVNTALIESAANITLKCGSASIVLTPAGLFFQGPTVSVNNGAGSMGAVTVSNLVAPAPPLVPQPAVEQAAAPAPAKASSPQTAKVTATQASTTPAQVGQAGEPKQLAQEKPKEQLVDIVHITGQEDFFALTQQESDALNKETDQVQALIDEFHQFLVSAGERSDCLQQTDPKAECACVRCKKQQWALKAQDAGLLRLGPSAEPVPEKRLMSDEDIQSKLRTLQQVRDWYQTYNPSLLRDGLKGSYAESNWIALHQIKLRQLQQEIAQLQTQLDASVAKEPPKPAKSKTLAKGARPTEDRAKRGGKIEYERGEQIKTRGQVTEVIILGRPDKRYYIRTQYLEKVSWKYKARSPVPREQAFSKKMAAALIDDIKKGVKGAADASPLGTLEAKLVSWAVEEDCLLNALHKEMKWTGNQADAAKYAVSAEAHFLRFAASASAGINKWDLKKGQVEVGIKGSAAFSLGEGKISLNRYYPSQGGRTLHLSYKNAHGQMTYHPFGGFRLHGKVELACFVGAEAKANVGATANYKPTEQPSGASVLLGTPSVEVSRGGRVGLKADAFAGAQAGGTLSGALEWMSPKKEGKGSKSPGQQMSSSDAWSKLAEVKGDGNVAFGLGAGIDFGLTITMDRLAFNCKASLVLGPGAGGGFATVVDFEKIYEMFKLVCDALAEVDYRYLLSISEDAFKYVNYGLYMVATSPSQAAGKAFEIGLAKSIDWWLDRSKYKEEAERLAKNLLRDQAVIIKGQRLDLNKLPPETMGPMLYVLSECFIESWHEDQEKAIVLLLSPIGSWRQFIEVLEHMSPKADKVNALESLNRLNAILDRQQQDEFNRFIHELSMNPQTFVDSGMLAWTTKDPAIKKDVLLAARNSSIYDGIA